MSSWVAVRASWGAGAAAVVAAEEARLGVLWLAQALAEMLL